MTIGERIKAARKLASVTQEELAAHIGYTSQHISNIECGVYKPSSRTIAAINRALHSAYQVRGIMKYTHHELLHELEDGTKVLWNRIQGKSVEDHASQCLRPLTESEALESAQIDEDDAFAAECEKDKAASLAQTELW